jgi:oxygen-dependent protoporphyrinogen oxidase
MTACSFGSLKWPHWSAPDVTVLRVSAGRYGDRRALDIDDDELVARLGGEIAAALRTTAAPTEWRVSRWPASFPQYLVGHLERVARIERALAVDLPGVAVAGAAYRGSGIPACIASGRRAAELVRAAA